MKRNTLILVALVVVLWGAWYLFSREEKHDLSVMERGQFFHADSTAVDSIEIKYATYCQLVRRDGAWQVVFPDWTYPADLRIVSDIFRFTNDMVLENLISTKAEKHEAFRVDTVRGTVLRFFSHGNPAAEFVMGKGGADMNHTYIRQLHSDSVYMARGDFQRVFRRVPADWPSKVLFDADSSQISRISWITKDAKIWVERDPAGSWKVYRDGAAAGLPVDTTVFNARLRYMCPLHTDAFALEGSGAVANSDSVALQLILDTKDGRADTLLWNAPKGNDTRWFAFHPGRPKPLFIFYASSYDRMKGIYADLVMKGNTKSAPAPGQ